ncbi:Polyketide cyclase / dehydrase and lipid transport [Gemmobacter megaterium]|uniref:Polyketide cyclase / dehydrase and lipid transport n=1 Tax=Gemmobacter megaterium TaxID=1086013 RepID=A0A1N7M158_9RHOB|nr:SRPBCC family protein [Gemmobacter megaterium]GGE09384.1 hypothetical protein GCM10011345_14030 [Gemmobacter megaterium]SIS79836.1 Polyketide cyclase / dehydrase and lipid transport [Gemmobacter megaterium]
MKFNAREDIEAPISKVWAVATDFDSFELAALRRGVDVIRQTGSAVPAWQATFTFKGKPRTLALRQERAEAPGLLVFHGEGRLVSGTMTVELVELGPRRTRMTVTTELRPLTLAARLFLQSVKLARGRAVRRYQQGVARLATMIEARSRGQAAGF